MLAYLERLVTAGSGHAYLGDFPSAAAHVYIAGEDPESTKGGGFGWDDAVSLGVGITPAGIYADIYTVLTGEDRFTGERIEGFWRYACLIPFASEIRKGSKIFDAASGAAAATHGTSVLGHYPAYLEKAAELGARRFNIPPEIWAKMSPAEQWAANEKFLDRLIMRGDQVVLTTGVDAVRRGSALEQEIRYLLGRGYQVVDDGMRLVPGP